MEAKEASAAPGAAALPETKDGPVSDEGHPLDAESLAKAAAFLFQSSRLQDCLHVLNQLLQKKQDDPKRIVLHVCLLLLDVCISLPRCFKRCRQGESGSNIQPQSNHGLKFSGINNIPASNVCSTDFSGSVNAQESALTRTLSDETLEYETLCSTLDSGTYNLERPTTNANSKLAAVASAVDLKLNLHLYKVRLLLLTRNLKAAMPEIKLAMNIARFGDSSVTFVKVSVRICSWKPLKGYKTIDDIQ
ncbi:uncharacterized protein LOC103970918 [Musa acuminata AAA Group]|uniref:uncharacterized protein LOC103970918 n=1 Tax=Musa acuminata AAA Group TaxID=214697 RepID=UPI0031D30F61